MKYMQHDPAFIPRLFEFGLKTIEILCTRPVSSGPHSLFRNPLSSKSAKRLIAVLYVTTSPMFNSFRLIRGDIGRARLAILLKRAI